MRFWLLSFVTSANKFNAIRKYVTTTESIISPHCEDEDAIILPAAAARHAEGRNGVKIFGAGIKRRL